MKNTKWKSKTCIFILKKYSTAYQHTKILKKSIDIESIYNKLHVLKHITIEIKFTHAQMTQHRVSSISMSCNFSGCYNSNLF